MIKQKKIIIILLFLILIFTALTAGLSTKITPPVGAVVITNNFDKTKVEDDLADVNMSQYPQNPLGTPRIMEFVEYCYSDNVFRQSNYGLYVYVYNPAQTEFNTTEGVNVVNMATNYNDKGEPDDFANTALIYLGSGYNGLVYKFKITNVSKIVTVATAYNKTFGERRYDIASLQLRSGNGTKDYTVGGVWHYTGYAKGYGTAENTLACTKTDTETLPLTAYHTYYRPAGTNGNGSAQDSLSSVYFSVPNEIKNKYGTLYSIKAEWLKAVTNWIFITGNNEVYQAIKPYIGKNVGSSNWDMGYGFGNYATSGTTSDLYYFFYNNFDKSASSIDQVINTLYYIFKAPDGKAKEFNLRYQELKAYMLNYTMAKSTPKVLDKYSVDLFESYDREKTVAEITADDTFSLTSAVLGSTFWELLGGVHHTTTYDGIKAIHEVVDGDFVSDDQVNCDNLYINISDFDAFKTFYMNAKARGETVYLFRFAVDDYTSFQTKQWRGDHTLFGVPYNDPINFDSYLAKETVYLDFDIIYLKYANDGDYHIIPVVMDPIDVIGDITHPKIDDDNGCNKLPQWLIIVIIVVCCIILLPVIIALLPWIIKLVVFVFKWVFMILWWIVSAPFKFVAWIVRKVRGEPDQ